MSRTGVFGVHRSIWDHPLLREKRPFSRREAWLWMVSEAAWKSTRVRVGGNVLQLKRGQLGHSLRYMAKAWGWSEARVRRFLTHLKTDAMIDAATDAGITVTTICNYGRYQIVGLPADAPTDVMIDAPATQQRRKEEEVKKSRMIDSDGGGTLPVNQSLISPEAIKLAEELGAIAGYPAPTDWPVGWCGAPARCQTYLTQGWRHELMVATARAVMAHKRDGPPSTVRYFEKPFAKAHTDSSPPSPTRQ